MSKERPSALASSVGVRPPCPFPLHSEDCPYSYSRQCNHEGPIFVIMLEHDKVGLVTSFENYTNGRIFLQQQK